MKKVWRWLGTLVAVFVVGLILTAVQLSSQGNDGELFIDHSTWQAPFVRVLEWGRESFNSWRFAPSLATQNTALIERNISLQNEVAGLKALERENDELRAMLALKKKRGDVVMAAELISRDPQDWFDQVVIDKGREDGVELDMVAVASGNLLGRVCALQPHSAQVRLITEERSAVPVCLASSGATGIMYGTEKRTCLGRYFQNELKFQTGELVQTSGLGEVYPAGIVVGHLGVETAHGDALFKEIEIIPNVDFGALHRVLLLRKRSQSEAPAPPPVKNP